MYKMTTALVLGIALTGCASMKPSVHTESTFVIYDVKPATLDRNQFLKAVLDAVQTSASKLRVNREIPPAELPATPGRFELQDPFANSKMGALLASQAQSIRVPVCKNALMTVSTENTSMGRSTASRRPSSCASCPTRTATTSISTRPSCGRTVA